MYWSTAELIIFVSLGLIVREMMPVCKYKGISEKEGLRLS